MSSDLELLELLEPPRQRRRLGSPEVEFVQMVRRPRPPRRAEIHVTRHVVDGREVISIDDSDDEIQARPRTPPRREREEIERAAAERAERARILHTIRASRQRRRTELEARAAQGLLFDDGDDDDDDYVPPNQHVFSPPPRPAPRQANIGLGGALLVQNGRPRVFGIAQRVHSFLDRFNPFLPYEADMMGDIDLPNVGGPNAIPPYRPEFTHPKVPPPYLHSFPASPAHDVKGKSTRPPPTSQFLCANCRDPLYLASPDAERRIYVLRCGHLIDGKCLRKLGTPPFGVFPELDKVEVLDLEPTPSKGKGKGKASTRSKGRAGTKGRGRKRKRVEKTTWQWSCPKSDCKHLQRSVWDEDAGEDKKGAWLPDPEEGAILFYG